VAAVLAVLSGCAKDNSDALRRELLESRSELDACRADFDSLQQENRRLREQVVALQDLGEARLESLFTVDRVEIGRYSSGVAERGDEDSDAATHPAADNAVRIFLTPVDRYGSSIKAAGRIEVRLYALAAEQGRTLVGEKTFPLETVHEYWSGGLFQSHFALECPFSRPVRHEEITVRVSFLDALTGRTHTAQRVVKVRPAASAATAPAGD
jgi:hypothetical protein